MHGSCSSCMQHPAHACKGAQVLLSLTSSLPPHYEASSHCDGGCLRVQLPKNPPWTACPCCAQAPGSLCPWTAGARRGGKRRGWGESRQADGLAAARLPAQCAQAGFTAGPLPWHPATTIVKDGQVRVRGGPAARCHDEGANAARPTSMWPHSWRALSQLSCSRRSRSRIRSLACRRHARATHTAQHSNSVSPQSKEVAAARPHPTPPPCHRSVQRSTVCNAAQRTTSLRRVPAYVPQLLLLLVHLPLRGRLEHARLDPRDKAVQACGGLGRRLGRAAGGRKRVRSVVVVGA